MQPETKRILRIYAENLRDLIIWPYQKWGWASGFSAYQLTGRLLQITAVLFVLYKFRERELFEQEVLCVVLVGALCYVVLFIVDLFGPSPDERARKRLERRTERELRRARQSH